MTRSNISSNAVPDYQEAEARAEVEHLAAQQGVTPVTDPDALRGDFWPENETVDDFINITRARRHIEAAEERA
ncbi:MAG: hypothetical protein ABR577_19015 [Pyrinomonadaceae bacterium]